MDKDIDYLTLKLKYNDLRKDYYKLKQSFNNQKTQFTKCENKLKRSQENEDYQFRLACKWAYKNAELKLEINDLKQKLIDALKDFDDIQKENDKLACQLKQESFTSNDAYQHYEFQIAELGKEIYRLQQRKKFLHQEVLAKEKELEECNAGWTEICDGKLETINRLIQEKQELQQQITEKDNRIAELSEPEAEKLGNLKTLIDKYLLDGYIIDKKMYYIVDVTRLFNEIDQQIKEMEGNK